MGFTAFKPLKCQGFMINRLLFNDLNFIGQDEIVWMVSIRAIG